MEEGTGQHEGQEAAYLRPPKFKFGGNLLSVTDP